MSTRTVRLYHFTSPDHLPQIQRDGFLKVTESNVSLRREHAGPDVVWLTTRDSVAPGTMGLDSAFHQKTAIRITFEVPRRDVHKWHDWARSRGSSEETIRQFAEAGGSGTWRVVQRPIPEAEWVAIDRQDETGPSLWLRSD